MVYIHDWQAYQEAAEALYEKSPFTARYCVKWRSSEGKLVLKITDNTTCLKFKTYSSIFLNRFEALNLSLMQKMQNKKAVTAAAPPPPSINTPPKQQARPSDSGAALSGSSVIPSMGTAGAAEGGVKKKKPKKKK